MRGFYRTLLSVVSVYVMHMKSPDVNHRSTVRRLRMQLWLLIGMLKGMVFRLPCAIPLKYLAEWYSVVVSGIQSYNICFFARTLLRCSVRHGPIPRAAIIQC